MAFDINKTFLSKKIKKTSRRKQWITFFVILFSIFLLLGQATRASFKIENYPELKILQEEEDSIASLFNSNQYRFYYGKPTEFKANLVGENGIIKFYPLESGEIIPVFESGREPINNYFYGRLIDLPEEMLAEIKSSLLENHEFLDENNTDWFVQNKMFEVIEEPSFDLFFTILISIILAYALWIWIRSRHFKRDPQKHPTFKAFAREGGELENFHQFNNEIESGDVRRFKYVVLTQNWLFYNGKFRLKLRHINDIVCAFKTKPVNNSLITRWASSKRDIVIGFIDKKQWAIKFKRNYSLMDEFKKALKERLPNIICDENDKETAKTWESRPGEIIDKYAQNVYNSKNQSKVKKLNLKVEEEPVGARLGEPVVADDGNHPANPADSPATVGGAVPGAPPTKPYIEEPPAPQSWTRRKRGSE